MSDQESLVTVEVLDSGDIARAVADLLGCTLRSTLPVAGEPPVLVVAGEEDEVEALGDVEDRSWIGGVVAWMLPEASIVRLYELGLPVIVGLPHLDEVVRRMDYPTGAEEREALRRRAERLAVVEMLLEPPAGS